MAESTRVESLEFGNLPLMEVAIRAALDQPLTITYSRVNAVHESLRQAFPILGEPNRYEVAPGSEEPMQFGPGTLLGALYSGGPGGIAVTIQRQVIVSRWVRQPTLRDSEYPRYAAMREAVRAAFAALAHACGDGVPRVSVVNMSYVNFLRVARSEEILRRYFSTDAQVRLALNAPILHVVETSWRERDTLDLRFKLRRMLVPGVGDPHAGEPIEGFELTTAAGWRLGAADEPMLCLDQVHAELIAFFDRLISDEAKREWQLRGARHV